MSASRNARNANEPTEAQRRKLLAADVQHRAKFGKLTREEREQFARGVEVEAAKDHPPTYFDTIAQAGHWFAAKLGLSFAQTRRLLRDAKTNGLPGFRGGRVYPADVLPALQTFLKTREHSPEGAETKEELDCRRLRAVCARIELENAIEQRRYIATETVTSLLVEVETRTTALLRQKLENEYPTACAGQEPAHIRIYGKRLVDDLCAQRAAMWSRLKPDEPHEPERD